jgi:uncharacterized protein
MNFRPDSSEDQGAVNPNLTRKFAADRQVATGTVRVGYWERARDAIVDSDVEIGYRIEGGADAQGRPMLTLELVGTVELTCQRSLHSMPFELGRQTRVLLASDQRELETWDREVDDAEVVLADQTLILDELLEDEFLLSLPYAPLCDDPACGEKLRRARGDDPERVPGPETDDANPFSVLKRSFSKPSH